MIIYYIKTPDRTNRQGLNCVTEAIYRLSGYLVLLEGSTKGIWMR